MMAPKEHPLDGLPAIDTGLIERRVLDRYDDVLSHARGPRRWLLERKVKKEIEAEVSKARQRAKRRSTSHSARLF
ncbi:MAG: hypothetical protein CMJ83_07955 [Planctomycetes bacterium]|nr:hypothetical protein [Planctomycetota bacterium]